MTEVTSSVNQRVQQQEQEMVILRDLLEVESQRMVLINGHLRKFLRRVRRIQSFLVFRVQDQQIYLSQY
jgi:hypothetical protein